MAPDDGQGGPLVPLLLFVTLHVVMAPTADGDSEFVDVAHRWNSREHKIYKSEWKIPAQSEAFALSLMDLLICAFSQSQQRTHQKPHLAHSVHYNHKCSLK